MFKKIPVEQLIALHNKLISLTPRDPERRHLVSNFADSFGVSESTVRRQLHQHVHFIETPRSDRSIPRVISQADMLLYCRIIAALKIRTSNKKNKHLSTFACINILENHGVETKQGLVKAPQGVLKKTTVNRYLKSWGFDAVSMKIEPPVVRFEAEHSNDCWQLDFTPSDLKKLSPSDNKTLFIANVTDDKSGMLYYEYVQADGEDALTALRFLFNAMSSKKTPGMSFQGIPKMIYTDNGAFAKSNLFKRTLSALGIELKTHLPKGKDGRRTTARSKGKIERANRTVKESFEPLFHLHQPASIEQANDWARNYLAQYNNMPHRSENCSRMEAWARFLPKEGYREMCSWEKFCLIVRDPESRKVSSDGRVSIDGVQYQLSTDMAGLEVILLHGVFDHELHVEFEGETRGPFYPSAGPIPLHTFKRSEKSCREKRADDIENLAKTLTVPLSVMTGNNDDNIVRLLNNAHVLQHKITAIPFEEKQPSQFQNRLEAKQAISRYLNRPLAELNEIQLAYIDQIVAESLEKEIVLSRVKQYFTLALCKSIER